MPFTDANPSFQKLKEKLRAFIQANPLRSVLEKHDELPAKEDWQASSQAVVRAYRAVQLYAPLTAGSLQSWLITSSAWQARQRRTVPKACHPPNATAQPPRWPAEHSASSNGGRSVACGTGPLPSRFKSKSKQLRFFRSRCSSSTCLHNWEERRLAVASDRNQACHGSPLNQLLQLHLRELGHPLKHRAALSFFLSDLVHDRLPHQVHRGN